MRLGEALARAPAYASACAWMAISVVAPRPAAAAEPPPASAEPALPSLDEARPALSPAPEPAPVPWQHHIEVGGGLAVSELLAHVDGDGKPTPVRFAPGAGFHVDLSWQFYRTLRFTAYMVEHFHALDLPPGSLLPKGTVGTLAPASMHAYSFGVRFSPMLPIGARGRIWVTGGGGFGYLAYDELTVAGVPSSALNPVPVLRARSEEIFEMPFGVGGSIDIIPRLLSIHAEVMATFAPSQIGTALQHGQYVDAAGQAEDVKPMPRLDTSFVQTLGISLHL
jgi:hypothetical protein